MISFSAMTKNELSKLEIEDVELARAELAAIIQISSSISLTGLNELEIEMGTENASIARRVFNLLKMVYDIQAEIIVRKNKNLKRTNRYIIMISDNKLARKILLDIGVLENEDTSFFDMSYRISEDLKKNLGTKRAYIRGAFLGAGSISNPERMYHLEFVTNDDEYVEDLLEMINSFNLNARIIERKEAYIIYIKEGSKVVDLLNIIEAHNSLLKLEDIRIMKEMRNNVNRVVNCETANLAKVADAAMRQVSNIEFINETAGLDFLPDNLRETAELRLAHRDISLKELGQLHNPKVGKSGVNHRLRKLEEIAEQMRESKE